MAYNPFNIFRRNQKAIFAVVTVFIMFTFVLSSGLGGGADFFDWFPQWLGGKARKGEHVCTLDGTKVYQGDLDRLNRDRVLANRFMDMAAGMALGSLNKHIADLSTQVSPAGQRQIMNIMQMARMGQGDPLTALTTMAA